MDVYKTDSSTNVTPEQISDLPTPDRDFQNLAFIAPGVERERGAFRFVTGGPVIGGGGNASQSTILVDGVDFTDPALGLAKTKFSQDAISEFRVINNRFDAEVGGSAGGALSILTKTRHEHARRLASSASTAAEALRAKGALEQDSTVDYERNQFGCDARRPDREGPDVLLRLVRADQLDDADALPAEGRVRLARRPTLELPFHQSPRATSASTRRSRTRTASRRSSTTSATARTTSASAASRTSRTARS